MLPYTVHCIFCSVEGSHQHYRIVSVRTFYAAPPVESPINHLQPGQNFCLQGFAFSFNRYPSFQRFFGKKRELEVAENAIKLPRCLNTKYKHLCRLERKQLEMSLYLVLTPFDEYTLMKQCQLHVYSHMSFKFRMKLCSIYHNRWLEIRMIPLLTCHHLSIYVNLRTVNLV